MTAPQGSSHRFLQTGSACGKADCASLMQLTVHTLAQVVDFPEQLPAEAVTARHQLEQVLKSDEATLQVGLMSQFQ